MKDQAIEKLHLEMDQDKNNDYVQVIGAFMIQYLAEYPEDAEKILNPEKTISESLAAMETAAKKKKKGNYAIMTGQEGLSIVLQYYGIERTLSISPSFTFSAQPKPATRFDVRLEDLL